MTEVHLSFRVDAALAADLRDLARRNERSASAETRLALRHHLNTNAPEAGDHATANGGTDEAAAR